MGNPGWGIQNPNLKYNTVYSQKGKSIDRWHLKYLDLKTPSNLLGRPEEW
jgi:hypothetical protein